MKSAKAWADALEGKTFEEIAATLLSLLADMQALEDRLAAVPGPQLTAEDVMHLYRYAGRSPMQEGERCDARC
jgi:hypothetical protein